MFYNVKTVEYPDSLQVRVYDRPVRVSKDIPEKKVSSDSLDIPDSFPERERTKEQIEHSLNESVNRSVKQVYALARANKWDYFVTLTINPKLLDSTDFDLVMSKINIWTNNLRKRYALNLKYLIVPELHKDRSKWHFHGLFANCGNIPFEFSGKVCVGKYIYDYVRKPYATKIYNLPLWKYGYSTATKIHDSGKSASYITKYITKEVSRGLPFRHRYLSSQNCDLPVEKIFNVDYDELQELLNLHMEKVDYVKNVKAPYQQVTYMEFNKNDPSRI